MNQEQKMKKAAYQKMVREASPKSKKAVGFLWAFLIGGAICTVGQLILELGKAYFGFDEATGAMFTSILMIFLGATLTGIGVYDRLGRFAGAGSIVPITGFANSIVAPAMEFRREGLITGVGAKMFVIAGPVLVYGILTSVAVGLFFYFFGG